MKSNFKHLLRVRYAECDAQQVVFNGRYVEYVDIAVTEFTRCIWGGYNEILEAGIDSQVVSLTIDWKSPAHFDDVLAISVQTINIGNTSYKVQFDFVDHETGLAIATAQVVYVMVSAVKHEKMPIPDDLRRGLKEGALGVISNHAGV